MTAQAKSWSRWQAWVIGSIAMPVLLACGSTVQVEKKKTDKEQVLDFIRKVHAAAFSNVLADEAAGMRLLGLRKDQVVSGRNTPWPRTEVRFFTGIPILDAENLESSEPGGIGYRIQPNKTTSWVLGFGGLLRRNICISHEEVVRIIGIPTSETIPYHRDTAYMGTYHYTDKRNLQIAEVLFSYQRDTSGQNCLDLVTTYLKTIS